MNPYESHFAESGQGAIIDNESCPTLSSLKQYLHTTTNIPIDQQILLTSSGTQLKDANYSPTHATEIFILFNRQHLERNTATGDDSNSSNHQEQNQWFKSLVESRIPTITGSEQLDQLHSSFTTLVNEYNERTQPQSQNWSYLNFAEFYQRFIKGIQQSVQEIANLASQHGIMADTLTQELKMQAIALNAALSNLDNHIKTTYDHQNKFDRIAKRELGKHTRWTRLVDKDLSFMHQIKLHSEIQTQINTRPDVCLIDCFSLTPWDSAKARLQKEYDRLQRKTNQIHERMDAIYQQSTNTNVQRTGSDAVVNKVTGILGDIQTYLSLIDETWLHLEQRWRKRDLDPSFDNDGSDQMMEGVIDKQQDDGAGNNNNNNNDDTTTGDTKATTTATVTTNSPSMETGEQQQVDISDKMDMDGSGEHNKSDVTKKRTDLHDFSDETLTQRLFSYESLIRQSLETIIDEKRNATGNFFQCLQTISTLEESIANLFLSLRHLGTDIKQLKQRTGQLETVSKGIIEGYGLMLIELWRRNQYYQIISKNAELLDGLFSTFASSEQHYRDKFQTDVYMTDGLDSLLSGNATIKDDMCIIPFICQEFTNEDQHCITIPSLDITLLPNHRHQLSDNNNSINNNNNNNNNNNKTIPLESAPLICKKDIDEFIDLMQTYYTTFQGDQGQTNDKARITAMVQRLSEKFDRESKRLSHGLGKLGLPSSKSKKKSSDVQFSPSSSSSSPVNTSNISTALPTLSSTASTTMQVQPSPTYNLPFVPSLSKKEWGSSSIYAQVQQQQDMKSRIDALEQELKHDQQVFEKQRSVLLEEIKMKDNQILEKEQQWESRWSAKVQEIQQQLELEQKAHENDILEWKSKYQEAMDTEQQKHYRRLAYFHERLAAKNAEYAELELQLTQSAPSSPVQATHEANLASSSLDNDDMAFSLTPLAGDAEGTKLPLEQAPYRWRRSASLDATAAAPSTSTDAFSKMIKTPVARTGRLKLATVRQPPFLKKSANQDDDGNTTTSMLSFKDDLYARELQDLTLRHQASVDNMVSEYEENRMELLAQHDREREVWKIEHDAELQDTCKKLAQEHESILNNIHQSWQQKWDDLVAQNKRDQVMQQQQWDQQLAGEKRRWEEKQSMERAALNKQLAWSKGELHMVLKEHETAIRLAKQLNLVIDHTTDVDDMKYTLLGLLEKGIQNASRLDSQQYLTEKSSESTSPYGFMSFF
ncbi:unnamed protein product [Absidia cylindrospora]